MAHRRRAFFIRWSPVLHSKDLLSPWGSLTYAIQRPPRLAALNGSKCVSSPCSRVCQRGKIFLDSPLERWVRAFFGVWLSILDNMSDHGLGLVHKPVPMILPRFENSRNVEMSIWLAVRLVYFGSGIPSWRQILRANRSAISVSRGTVVTRRGSARFHTYCA